MSIVFETWLVSQLVEEGRVCTATKLRHIFCEVNHETLIFCREITSVAVGEGSEIVVLWEVIRMTEGDEDTRLCYALREMQLEDTEVDFCPEYCQVGNSSEMVLQ